MTVRVSKLTCDRQSVRAVEALGLRVHAARRREVSGAEELPEALEPVAEDGQTSFVLGVQRPAEIVQEDRLGLLLLQVLEVLPLLGLALPHKGKKGNRVDAPIAVEVVSITSRIAA